MKYEVNLFRNGATSPIDVIEAPAGYTPEQYAQDCRENADAEWIEMIESGEIILNSIED